MSKGTKVLLSVLIVLLLAAVGGGAFLFMKMSAAAKQPATPAVQMTPEQEAASRQADFLKNLATVKYVKLTEFTTDPSDQFSWAKITVQLALKDEAAVTLAKGMQPTIERTCLYEIRKLNAKQLQGADGMTFLENTLDAKVRALNTELNAVLYKVLVTQLAVQQ